MNITTSPLRSTITALALNCPLLTSYAQGNLEASILNIHIGMPASSAWDILNQHKAKYGNLMQLQKVSLKSKCTTCPDYVGAYWASYSLANRHPGPLSTDEVTVLLSPGSEDSVVVAVKRKFLLKEPVPLSALTDQLIAKHGTPNQSMGGIQGWFLDEKRQKSRQTPVVHYSTGTLGAVHCFQASGPGFRMHTLDIAKSNSDPDQDLLSGEFSYVNAKCGTTVYFLSDAGNQNRVQFVDISIIDHQQTLNAGVKAKKLLMAQNDSLNRQEEKTMKTRPVPKLD